MIAGFTGTRAGMTDAQKAELRAVLLANHVMEIHLGDCVGADAEAHGIAVELGIRTVGHPPTNPSGRAFCEYDEELPPKPYLDRDRDIVDASQQMFAGPKGPEINRSGTWYTVRYARRCGVPTLILSRDGQLTLQEVEMATLKCTCDQPARARRGAAIGEQAYHGRDCQLATRQKPLAEGPAHAR